MGAGHNHHHNTGDDYSRAFAIGIAINIAIVVVEAVFGFISGSMALLADAGHNLSDVLSLVVAWAGARMARRSPSPRFTYGLKKASILAALINALLLLVAVGAIAAEAIRRLFDPAPAHAPTMIWIAALAIVGNLLTALLFARGRKRDINVRAAYQHMAADAAVSAAVVFAGIVILWTGQAWVDPVMSLAVAAVILWGSIGLMRESVGMSLMGVPAGIDLDEVELELGRLEGVETVHDLHVWPLSTTETALTAHLVAPEVASTDALLANARRMLHDRFHIDHCTIQVERAHLEDSHCR
ncbi:cation transporter [Sphingomonas lutea]|uniref:Cation transporter n=1 Tax=Sphingomonas lutea TaxID=1045317 RepID=A0A7G9SH53_9SPHN|nr:cation diffusion facilitator family transporter [Sphingomonas lutea]QNN67178.1 cation transporter [Sphingomonas lutea]